MTYLSDETIEYLKARRRVGLANQMSNRSLARHGGKRRQRFMGRARLFLGKSVETPADYSGLFRRLAEQILKDDGGISAGDVHIPSAIGNSELPRRRRPKLSLGSIPNAEPIR